MSMTISHDQSQLSQIQTRSDFINRFNLEHNLTNRNMNSGNETKGRWEYLHDLNKLRHARLEEQRKIQKKKEEEEMFSECTFTPQLNRSVNYGTIPYHMPQTSNRLDSLTNKSALNGNNNICPDSTYDLLGRQEAWKQKKNNKINTLREAQSSKEIQECNFTPVINKSSALNKSHIKSSAAVLLEDPESYQMYVSRLAKKREDEINRKKRENSTPGSGNVWSSKRKKYNMSYDYTKHEIADKVYARSKSNRKFKTTINKPGYARNKVNITDKDKYYDYLYKSNDTKNTVTNRESTLGPSSILYQQQMEYGKAVELLHNELFSIQLIPDDDD